MKQLSKRSFGAMLAIIMIVSMLPISVLTAKAFAPTYATGDIITYGSYPQSKVTDSTLISALNAQTLSADNTVTYDGSKYKQVYFTTTTNSNQAANGYNINTVYWFKFESVQWRVLSNTNGKLFVMAEKILDCNPYNQGYLDVTWETCTLRTWLNNDFYNTAFTSAEQAKIETSAVVNDGNPVFGTDGGNNTSDKLFLPSDSEVRNSAYGFNSDTGTYDTARMAQGTDFSKSNGLFVITSSSYPDNSYWWLRTPGYSHYTAGSIANDSIVNYGHDVNSTFLGARPALKINLTNITSTTFATGDIITYGSYPQSKVTDSTLISALNAQTLSADNTVTYDGSKYKQVYFTTTTNSNQAANGYNINTVYWFKFESVQWRVLSNTNGELFVMAEKILDCNPYNQGYLDVTWETCTLRTWLNNDFYNTAFTSAEQAKIETSAVVNDGNPVFGTDGGNNTSDKLFLPSDSEVRNSAYGFNSDTGTYDTARMAQGTDFSKSNGLFVITSSSYPDNSYWWLRTPGYSHYTAGSIANDSIVNYGHDVNSTFLGIRPALKINLTSDIFTSKTGSNCLINYSNNFIYGLAPGTTSLVDYTDVAAGYELEYGSTANGFGTGTVVNVTLDGVTVESYTIVIYGDANGDGSIDSIDAGTIVDVGNYIISWDPAADAATIEAGDLNGDGSIDGIDAGIVVDAENYIVAIDQTLG